MTDKKVISDEKSSEDNGKVAENWAESMKEAMEEYIEEQGIYIRQ